MNKCWECVYNDYSHADFPCIICHNSDKSKPKPQTNGDRIRAMTDNKELAIEMLNPTYFQKSPSSKPSWCTSSGKEFTNFDEAVKEQVAWLQQTAE
jgi:hypothetical protein